MTSSCGEICKAGFQQAVTVGVLEEVTCGWVLGLNAGGTFCPQTETLLMLQEGPSKVLWLGHLLSCCQTTTTCQAGLAQTVAVEQNRTIPHTW